MCLYVFYVHENQLHALIELRRYATCLRFRCQMCVCVCVCVCVCPSIDGIKYVHKVWLTTQTVQNVRAQRSSNNRPSTMTCICAHIHHLHSQKALLVIDFLRIPVQIRSLQYWGSCMLDIGTPIYIYKDILYIYIRICIIYIYKDIYYIYIQGYFRRRGEEWWHQFNGIYWRGADKQ